MLMQWASLSLDVAATRRGGVSFPRSTGDNCTNGPNGILASFASKMLPLLSFEPESA
jgi:hypothetical protein